VCHKAKASEGVPNDKSYRQRESGMEMSLQKPKTKANDGKVKRDPQKRGVVGFEILVRECLTNDLSIVWNG